VASLAGRELGTERGGDVAGIAELGRRGRGGFAWPEACLAVGVDRVQQPAAQLGDDVVAGAGGAGQRGGL
jgi:hypothetical protein